MDLQALKADNRRLRKALADAASEIPTVVGPVAHRIRVLRQVFSDDIMKRDQRIAALENQLLQLLKTKERPGDR